MKPEKALKKLLKVAKKTVDLKRKKFGSINDLIKLRRAIAKYEKAND